MNDITGRCMTNNALESAYCGSYHPMPAAKVINQPDMPMETNNMGMEIQYNNLIEIDDCQESQATPFAYQSSQPQRLQQNRKRNNYDCDIDSIANVKRCRREDAVAKRTSSSKLPKPSECGDKPKYRDDVTHEEMLLMCTHGSSAYHWQGHEL
ncbi:uncharacterized protein [Atheta coriaria]